MKQKIAISVLEFDGQYDVEVYHWIDALQTKGILLEELTEYAFTDQDEAIAYIKEVKETYNIVKLEQLAEEELETLEDNPLTIEAFWHLIDLSLEQKNLTKQREWLMDVLSKMSDEKIESFEKILRSIKETIYRHKQCASASQLAGIDNGVDNTNGFCLWLLSRGKEVMEDVLAEPSEVTYYLNDKNLNEHGRATNALFGKVADDAMQVKRTAQLR